MASQEPGPTRTPIRALFEGGTPLGRSDPDLLDQFVAGPPEAASRAFDPAG